MTTMAPPAILFVLNSLTAGGSETKIVNVANALARSGVAVHLAYLNPPETVLTRVDGGVFVTRLDRRGKYSFGALRRLHLLIGGENQVVIAVNLYPLLYVIPAVDFKRAKKARIVGLVNTADLTGKERYSGLLYGRLLKRCDRVVFGCVAQRSLWIDKYRLSPDRALVIYNGVNHGYYSPAGLANQSEALRRQHGIPFEAFVVGSIGRLAPEKSFDLLISAVARLNSGGREAYLIIAGQGPEQAKLERMAVLQGMADKIRFLGLQEDVRPALSIMDVFALPSTAVETFSNAALEAMSMGRAVVISDMGGGSEMVENGESGFVVPAGDADVLTDSLASLYDSRELREQFGLAARRRVVSNFTFETMVEQYRQLMPSR